MADVGHRAYDAVCLREECQEETAKMGEQG